MNTDKILDIIADILIINKNKLSIDNLFLEDLNFDSLDFASMYYQLESIFDITVDMEKFLQCKSIQDIIFYVNSELERRI